MAPIQTWHQKLIKWYQFKTWPQKSIKWQQKKIKSHQFNVCLSAAQYSPVSPDSLRWPITSQYSPVHPSFRYLVNFWCHDLNWCQLINIWGHVLLIICKPLAKQQIGSNGFNLWKAPIDQENNRDCQW